MSFEAVAIAMNHSRAKGTARLVLIGIANHDGDGGSWPSIATLQRYAGGVDRSTVVRAIAQLERLGEVRRIIQGGGDHSVADHRRPNRYLMLLTCPHDCDRSRQHRTSRTAELALPDELSTGVAPAPPHGVDARGTGGVDATQTSPSNSLGHYLQTNTGTRARGDEDTCPNARDGQHRRPNPTGNCIRCGLSPAQRWNPKTGEIEYPRSA